MKSIVVRMPEQTLAALQNLATAREATISGLIRNLIHDVHDRTRESLDAESLHLFDEGKLDRVGWGAACIRYQQQRWAATAQNATTRVPEGAIAP
jgi:hypothetical protein